MKTKTWIFIFGAVMLLCAALSAILLWPRADAVMAEVRSDGEIVMRLDLAMDQTVTVESANGTNVITVKDGKVAVTEADCPDHICMDRGYCAGGTPIVCLPNKLVIEFVGEQAVDGAVG